MVDDTGGLARVTAAFANHMVDRGHTVNVIYSDEKEGSPFFSIDERVGTFDLRHYKGETIPYPMSLRIKRELLRLVNKKKALEIRQTFNETYLVRNLQDIIDTIHPQVIVSFQSAATKLLLRDLQVTIPVVTMHHGDLRNMLQELPEEEVKAIEESTVNQVLLPVFKEILSKDLPKARVTVIGNAIPEFKEVATLEEKLTYTVGYVGLLTKSTKRPHILVEAFSKVAAEFPEWNLKLWGAKESKVYFNYLQRLVKQANLEDRIHFMGTTSDVPAALRSCDIFGFPSAREGFPLALGEAMSSGLPVVACKSCIAATQLVVHEKSGVLVDEGVDAFAEGLSQLMEDISFRKKMGQEGRALIKRYTPEVIWNEWEGLLNQLVSTEDVES